MLQLDDSYFSCSSSSSDDYASADSDVSVHLSDLISSKFSQHRKFLNIVHINAQSVSFHFSDVLSTFHSDTVDAVLISESFLKPGMPSTQYSLPGFKLLRNDRTGKGCGGVAIYLRDDIKHKIIDKSPNDYSKSSEHLFIEIVFQHQKLLLGVFYCPSKEIDYFDSFEAKLEHFCPLYEHKIILGDFNTCLIRDDPRSIARSSRLQSIVSSVNMHILPLTATHHAPNKRPSLIDLILVSNPSIVATHGQLTAPFSYHDLIYISYKIRPEKRKPKYLLLRSYKNIDLVLLKEDAKQIDWSPVLNADNIDDKIRHFNLIITQLFDKHAPIKKVKVKRPPAPWLNESIKRAMSKRDKAKRKLKKNPSEENFATYKKLRNRCNRLCRDAKRRYIHDSVEQCNPAHLWKFLKTLGVGKSSDESSFDFDLNLLNSHFSTPPISLDSNVKTSTLKYLSDLPLPLCNQFALCAVDSGDVKKSFLSISSKATGTDELSSKMLNLILDELLPCLTHIFNHSLSSSSFPCLWKKAHVILLPKVANPSSASEFRPISILPFLSKVLENIVHKQLFRFLNSNNLLSPFQSGFRPGHSTVTALVKVADDIRQAMDRTQLTVLTLLDFSSAFNSVDFDILLAILSTLNVSPEAIAWFNSYLVGRTQCVRVDQASSDWVDLAVGVPQGGVLSPLLFSVFINSLTNSISSNFHLYADDLQLYRHFRADEASDAINQLNADLCRISEWAQSFGLRVNPSKSQTLLIGGTALRGQVDLNELPPVIYNAVAIEYANTAKNLGVIFDKNLSWTSQVNNVSKKVHFSFQSLKRLQKFVPYKTKVLLAQALLLPIIDYADVCYLDATEELLNKLERLQNLCIRFIFGLRKYDHVSEYRSRLKWLPIRRRRDAHILSVLYNLLHNPSSPLYLRERFEYLVPRGQPCRSITSLLLKFPTHSSTRYGESFTVHAVRLWNALPHVIRDSPSIHIFKSRVREHYLSSST